MNTKDALTASVGTALSIWKRVWPLIGITVALLANVAWIVLLGYYALKLLI
jgi:hypothetical protein